MHLLALTSPQEEKFKAYYNDLHWALTEYDRVVMEVSEFYLRSCLRGRPLPYIISY